MTGLLHAFHHCPLPWWLAQRVYFPSGEKRSLLLPRGSLSEEIKGGEMLRFGMHQNFTVVNICWLLMDNQWLNPAKCKDAPLTLQDTVKGVQLKTMAGYWYENVTSWYTCVWVVFTHYHFCMCLTFAALFSQWFQGLPYFQPSESSS